MDLDAVGAIAFDEWYPLAAESSPAGTGAPLVAALEQRCLREFQRHAGGGDGIAVSRALDCRYPAPAVAGARVRFTGWVAGLGDRVVTYRVLAQDEHELVCEGTIRLALAPRGELARRLAYKLAAIERRALFATPRAP